KNGLKHFLPERYLTFLLEQSQIDPQQPFKQLTEKQKTQFIDYCKQFPMHIHDTWPLEKTFVTGGGIALKEIHPRSLESKLVEGLFFTGEVLDINGYTGGYNITAAFVTGYVAGKHAAEIASYSHY